MNQQNQVIDSFPPSGLPLKRKRGRPRKDKSQIPSQLNYVPTNRKSQIKSESAPVPTGFESVNGDQPQPADAVDVNNEDPMVGQIVTGVIEATFEAGYLLSVRVGESDISLRGIVFKPGHYVPVSAENDVAPGLQMIRRNEVPFPSANQEPKRRGRQRAEYYAAYPSNLPPSNQLTQVRSGQIAVSPAQASHPVGEKGTLEPVILQPVNQSKGETPFVEAPPIASDSAHLLASKAKTTTTVQAAQEELTKGPQSQTDSGSASQPFEELVSAAKKMQGSPESSEAHYDGGKSSNNLLPDDSSLNPEQEQDLSKLLSANPLQSIQYSGVSDQSAPLSHSFTERRTGKMTELLLAVQENLMERQMTEGHQQDFKSPEK